MRFAVIKRRYTSNQRQQDCECNGSLEKAYKSLNLEAQDVEINRFVAVAVDGQVTVYGRRRRPPKGELRRPWYWRCRFTRPPKRINFLTADQPKNWMCRNTITSWLRGEPGHGYRGCVRTPHRQVPLGANVDQGGIAPPCAVSDGGYP